MKPMSHYYCTALTVEKLPGFTMSENSNASDTGKAAPYIILNNGIMH